MGYRSEVNARPQVQFPASREKPNQTQTSTTWAFQPEDTCELTQSECHQVIAPFQASVSLSVKCVQWLLPGRIIWITINTGTPPHKLVVYWLLERLWHLSLHIYLSPSQHHACFSSPILTPCFPASQHTLWNTFRKLAEPEGVHAHENPGVVLPTQPWTGVRVSFLHSPQTHEKLWSHIQSHSAVNSWPAAVLEVQTIPEPKRQSLKTTCAK